MSGSFYVDIQLFFTRGWKILWYLQKFRKKSYFLQ